MDWWSGVARELLMLVPLVLSMLACCYCRVLQQAAAPICALVMLLMCAVGLLVGSCCLCWPLGLLAIDFVGLLLACL